MRRHKGYINVKDAPTSKMRKRQRCADVKDVQTSEIRQHLRCPNIKDVQTSKILFYTTLLPQRECCFSQRGWQWLPSSAFSPICTTLLPQRECHFSHHGWQRLPSSAFSPTRSTASLAETASTCFRNQRFCQGQTCLKLAVARLACVCLLLFLIVPARFLLILSLACSCSKCMTLLPQQGCHLRSAAHSD